MVEDRARNAISTTILKELGQRQRQPPGTTSGYCREISRGLAKTIEEYDVKATTYETAIGSNHATHVCVLVHSREIEDIDTDLGTTIVDATIDQFNKGFFRADLVSACVGNLCDLPAVGVYPPNSPERKNWYKTNPDK